MKRTLVLLYGLGSYGVFFASFLYVIGFLSGQIVPKTVNSGDVGPVGAAVAINLKFIALFGVPHTIMARTGFKKWWTTIVPAHLERSTYVLLASLTLFLLYWQWRPMPELVWNVQAEAFRGVIWAAFVGGIVLILYASFCINHFDLFGLRQVYLYWRGIEYFDTPFVVPILYKIIRHPLLVGWMITFWATPTMTQGHLLFALANTIYMFIAMPFEERGLSELLGDDYRRYLARTPRVLPVPWGRSPKETS
jgi:protein-S-isoprenylcysteine O-methyltransferase Ste14